MHCVLSIILAAFLRVLLLSLACSIPLHPFYSLLNASKRISGRRNMTGCKAHIKNQCQKMLLNRKLEELNILDLSWRTGISDFRMITEVRHLELHHFSVG